MMLEAQEGASRNLAGTATDTVTRRRSVRSVLTNLLLLVSLVLYIYGNALYHRAPQVYTREAEAAPQTSEVVARLRWELARPSKDESEVPLPRDVAVPALGQTRALAVACAERLHAPLGASSRALPVTVVMGAAVMRESQSILV